MPRRNNSSLRKAARGKTSRIGLSVLSGVRTVERKRGVEWIVQQIAGNGKTYICPGCNSIVAGNAVHLVVWSNEYILGDENAIKDRRHWHKVCWKKFG